MPRPFKKRVVCSPPGVTVFKPAGVPARDLNWITMTIDEYEAVRLADHEGLDQEAAAEQLGVSRPTVSRTLARGRTKLARMLATGAALVIEGGPVHLPEHFRHGREHHGGGGWGRGRGGGGRRGGARK